ncbi:hypothetical protein [Flavobacterium sp. IMCC34518]|uniref:hypothetical protein n=1 Tax=Flavobacterium sp. IMCC34518 TaxID=3003623 RepID=UPI0022ABD607|nr:hypothetical protein [Flavobacterium sp. IMCC34518]
MSPSYNTKTLVCLLLSCFSLVWAKGKVAQSLSIEIDEYSGNATFSKDPNDCCSYMQLPALKAFQNTYFMPSKRIKFSKKRKGKIAFTE